mmetsp:Transcript_23040/g.54440  ORF Transcript_23040/g.54440 Transcript_23040/m.54440 type:complete len:237 (-) Transcript_23040:1471-2181(-)
MVKLFVDGLFETYKLVRPKGYSSSWSGRVQGASVRTVQRPHVHGIVTRMIYLLWFLKRNRERQPILSWGTGRMDFLPRMNETQTNACRCGDSFSDRTAKLLALGLGLGSLRGLAVLGCFLGFASVVAGAAAFRGLSLFLLFHHHHGLGVRDRGLGGSRDRGRRGRDRGGSRAEPDGRGGAVGVVHRFLSGGRPLRPNPDRCRLEDRLLGSLRLVDRFLDLVQDLQDIERAVSRLSG